MHAERDAWRKFALAHVRLAVAVLHDTTDRQRAIGGIDAAYMQLRNLGLDPHTGKRIGDEHGTNDMMRRLAAQLFLLRRDHA